VGAWQILKKGPFHIVKQVGLAVSPLIIVGAFELWPPSALFAAKGKVTLRCLPQIKLLETDDYTSILSRSRRIILKGTTIPEDPKAEPYTNNRLALLFLPTCYFMLYVIYSYLNNFL